MWQSSPQNLSLQNSDIHIWLVDIESFTDDLTLFYQTLSIDELSRAKKYKFAYLQDKFIINRGFLRLILAKYLSIKAKDIELAYNHKGKPFLVPSNQSKINFNLSHKNKYTIYAVSNNDLGIDLEAIKSDIEVENIAKRFFTNHEYNDICCLQKEEKLEYFFQLWTAKEAYLKAIGEGLSGGLNSINLQRKNNETKWNIEIANLSPEENKMWQISTFKLMNNYWASLAIKVPHDLKIKYYLVDSLFLN